MSSDTGHTWWLALDGEQVLGFCAARRHRNGTVRLIYGYVLPECRQTGIYRRLFDQRLREVLTWPDAIRLESTVNPGSARMFLENDFEVIGEKGNYRIVERRIHREESA
jgi:hypothetical protein